MCITKLSLLVVALLCVVSCSEKRVTTDKEGDDKVVIGSGWPKIPIFGRPSSVTQICTESRLPLTYTMKEDSSTVGYGNLSQASAMGRQMESFSTVEPNISYQTDNSGKVKNAEADIVGDVRCVIYNETYMRFLDNRTSYNEDDWASISVLAHEIGHHILGHTKSNKKNEIAADMHSGWCMRKMNASKDQAISVFRRIYPNDPGDDKHPSSEERIRAVIKGYDKADDELKSMRRNVQYAVRKCLDSLSVDACKQCAEETSVVCQELIKSGHVAVDNSLDTCQKSDLYNVLASSISRMNSYVSGRDFIEAQKEKLKVEKTINLIRSPIVVSTNAKCSIEKNGKIWDMCKAQTYEDLAYKTLFTSDLNLSKEYFAISYSAFPWIGTVDEVYHKVFTPILMKRYDKASEKDKKDILNEVYLRISKDDIYRGIPTKYRQILIGKVKEIGKV